jgi:hypothetical protein
MQFSVTTADEVETSYDGMYEVESNGVLKIMPAEHDASIIRLSPAFWWRIKQAHSSYDILDSVR